MGSRELLEHRKPLEDLEAEALRRHHAAPQDVGARLLDGLRYVINFAKLTAVRDVDGHDHDLADALRPFAFRVRDTLERALGPKEDGLWAAVRELPELVQATRALRRQVREHMVIDRASLDAEVCNRKLVLVLGGGGGAGYGYPGIFTQLHRHDLEPSLICGTSIGALMGLFRARSRAYDAALMLEANRKLQWNDLFRIGPEESRYGLPATMRVHLRHVLGDFFKLSEGRVATISELPIPVRVIATGLTVDALRHELSYYEHFLDDVIKPGMIFRTSRLTKLGSLAQIFRELSANPQALREVVFGMDPGTEDMDCLDCAGFSASVPGLLHYDIHREDERMKHMLDRLYADRGITRLTEGGVVNNVPARIGFKEAMAGTLDGRRNVCILAVDCFRPKPTSLMFYPLQQIARANVVKNIPYCNVYLQLERTLSPANLVPKVHQVAEAARWASDALEPHVPMLVDLCRPFEALREE